MFKRKILFTIVPFLATATLVGSGFGAWYFAQNIETKNSEIGVVITDKVSTVGAITTTEDTYRLELDQGGAGDAATNVDKGLSFLNDNNEVVNTFAASYSISTTELAKLKDAGYKVEIKVDIKIAEALYEYVVLQDLADYTLANETAVNGNFVYTRELTSDNLTDDGTNSAVDLSIDLTTDANGKNALVKYTANKPTNSADYDAMVTAVGGAKITFSFSATVVVA